MSACKNYLPLVARHDRGHFVDDSRGLQWAGALGVSEVADFIVLACNSHYELLAACEAAEPHFQCVCDGGIACLFCHLRAAIARATEEPRA